MSQTTQPPGNGKAAAAYAFIDGLDDNERQSLLNWVFGWFCGSDAMQMCIRTWADGYPAIPPPNFYPTDRIPLPKDKP